MIRTSGSIRMLVGVALGLVGAAGGCSSPYKGIVKPVGKFSVLSPELEGMTDAKIRTYLVFPSVLAVAKLAPRVRYYGSYREREEPSAYEYQYIRGEEAQGWRKMVELKADGHGAVLTQVQFISPLVMSDRITLKSLRDSAALLHAPLLLVYVQAEDHEEGTNSAAMAYWTIVGLFTVPGNTVGHYTSCPGVIVDTQSGFILATVEGEGKREENVLPGAVDIAGQRTQKQATAEAIATLQKNAAATLSELARSRGKWMAVRGAPGNPNGDPGPRRTRGPFHDLEGGFNPRSGSHRQQEGAGDSSSATRRAAGAAGG